MIALQGEIIAEQNGRKVSLHASKNEVIIDFPDWKILERGYRTSSFFSALPFNRKLLLPEFSQPIIIQVNDRQVLQYDKGKLKNLSFGAFWKLLGIWFRVKILKK